MKRNPRRIWLIATGSPAHVDEPPAIEVSSIASVLRVAQTDLDAGATFGVSFTTGASGGGSMRSSKIGESWAKTGKEYVQHTPIRTKLIARDMKDLAGKKRSRADLSAD